MEDDLADIIEKRLDGDDYDRGSFEAARATADNAVKVLANLMVLLRDKKILTNEEVSNMISGIW